MIPNPSKCSVCAENSHSSRDCPCLYSPLKEGFYSGGGGGGGHSHDEDESIQVKRIPFYSFQSNKHSRSVQNIPKTILTHTLLQEHLA